MAKLHNDGELEKDGHTYIYSEDLFNESGILYRAGVKKYGKEGMKKIQQAAGKKKSHAAIGAIKDKYEKGKKEGIAKQEIIVINMKDLIKQQNDMIRKESGMNIKEDKAGEYEKLRKNFEKTYKAYWDAVYDYEQGLKKQGLKKEAMTVHRKYMKNVLGFHAWMRQWIRKVYQ